MSAIEQMPYDARVWVYQSKRILSDAEVNIIKKSGTDFIVGWAAHGANLKASFDVVYNRFIVIAVDEKQAAASGCSIDKSVRFVKELDQQFDLNLFDRLQVAYRIENEIKSCHLSEFEKLAAQNIVDGSTIVFNNMVSNKTDFDKQWEIPLKKSWQSRVLT